MKRNTSNLKIILLSLTLLFVNQMYCQWQQIGTDIFGSENYGVGHAISMNADGTILAVGSPNADFGGVNSGQVRILSYDGDDWAVIGEPINGDIPNAKLGYSVALSDSGSRVIFGTTFITTPNGNFTGKANVLEWNGSSWLPVGDEINGFFNGDNFGWAVSISENGNRVAVSAPYAGANGSQLGEVRIYELTGSTWQQIGTKISGQANMDLMGFSIKLSGDGNRIAMGSHQNDEAFPDAGNIRVFEWNGTTWSQLGETINGLAETDFFGKNVDFSADGNRVIGSSISLLNFTGEIRAYDWNGTSWIKKGESIFGENNGDSSGTSVKLSADGSTILIGSPDSQGDGQFRGQSRVFKLVGETWQQVDNAISGVVDLEFMGFSAAISANGETIAIGTPLSSLNGAFSGVARVYNGGVLNVDEVLDSSNIVLYPNPTRDIVTFDLGNVTSKINIVQYDMFGKEINSLEANDQSIVEFSVKGSAGVYFLKISANEMSKSIKIIKD